MDTQSDLIKIGMAVMAVGATAGVWLWLLRV
jgi:hypothetical protein